MSQRVLLLVSPTWRDPSVITDWIKRLPKGATVLYSPSIIDEDGCDPLGDLIASTGVDCEACEVSRDNVPDCDACLMFSRPGRLYELPIALAVFGRGIRYTAIPEAR